MNPRRLALLVALLLAFSASFGASALFRRRRSSDPGPGGTLPVPATESKPDAVAPTPDPASSAQAEPSVEAEASGWIRVTLEIPDGLRAFSVHASVLTPEGPIECSSEFSEVAQFQLGPLKPGAKAVLVYSRDGRLGAATALATVLENRVTDVSLRPPTPFPIEGVLVDASGQPLADLEVNVSETLLLKGFRQGNGIGAFGSRDAGGGGGGSSRGSHGGGTSYSYFVSSEGIRFSFGSRSDRQGRFSLWLPSGPSPVSLRVLRDYKQVLEQAIVPSAGPFRLVVPEAPVPPK